jgi:hypothetical protein
MNASPGIRNLKRGLVVPTSSDMTWVYILLLDIPF